MIFRIVSDSSSDLYNLSDVEYVSVPLKIITDEKEYIDTPELDVDGMTNDLLKYKGTSRSSCPNMEDWKSAFEGADGVFCVSITRNLSGSYNSAKLAVKEFLEENPDKKAFVADTLTAGPECALIVEKLRELILSGLDFEEIKEELIAYQKTTHLLFALESMRNLANNGRISHAAAKMAGLLGIRAVGKADMNGTLEMVSKVRGADKTVEEVFAKMKEHGYSGKTVRIHHCQNPEISNSLKEKILSEFPSAKVTVGTTAALCSFYAERGGFLVGYEGAEK